MRLIQYQTPFVGLEHEINRLFGQAGAPEGRRFPIQLHEDKDNAYVRVELPGVKRQEIAVEVVDGSLTVTAERKPEPRPTGEAAPDTEAGAGDDGFSYSRTVSLPEDVQADKVVARYEDGVLTVTLPKREAAKPRRIELS